MSPPGWESPEFVRSVHQALEGLAIFFFAALVVFGVIAHLETLRHKLFERIGLVCFGIAILMEVIAYPYGKRNDELAETHSKAQQLEIARLNNEAGLARREASEANERSKGFDASIASSNAEAKQAVDRAAKAEARTADSRLELARIQEKMADRVLTDHQAREISKKLSRFAGQEFEITTYPDSREPLAVSNRVLNILESSRWRFIPMTEWRGMMGGITGIQIWRHPDSDQLTKDAANALSWELSTNGFAADIRIQNPQNNSEHNRIGLVIGEKPH